VTTAALAGVVPWNEGYCTCLRCDLAGRLWAERPALLRIARRRTVSESEATDVVDEAIARALEAPDLEPNQVPAWLTRVTINLCIDLARDRGRAPKRLRYQLMQNLSECPLEERVADRLAAEGVGLLVAQLPPSQRWALNLRAEGRSLAEVAQALQLSIKATESLLSRARSTLRPLLRATVVALGSLVVRGLRRSAPAMAPTAVALVVLIPVMTQLVVDRGRASGSAAPGAAWAQAAEAAPAGPLAGPVAPVNDHRLHPVRAVRPANSAGTRTGQAPRRDLSAGPVRVKDAGQGRTHGDESLGQSIERCVSEGLVVSTDYIGCRSAQPRG
jgi:RNA polymerase sigma factor (sigma-70 family)